MADLTLPQKCLFLEGCTNCCPGLLYKTFTWYVITFIAAVNAMSTTRRCFVLNSAGICLPLELYPLTYVNLDVRVNKKCISVLHLCVLAVEGRSKAGGISFNQEVSTCTADEFLFMCM